MTTRTDDPGVAEAIARTLVDMRLASATHLDGPSRTRYWWKDQIVDTDEWVVRVVTTPAAAAAVADQVRLLHDYGLPSITVEDVQVSADYAAWVAGAVSPPDR